jgi:hypothetical protein
MTYITAVAVPRVEVLSLDGSQEVLARGVISTLYPNPVWIFDVKTMVTNVLLKANKRKILRLNIIDHGNKDGCFFGEDWITTGNFEKFAPHLGLLSSALDKSGFVHLQHCEVGQNENLLQLFAAIFGVPVYAGTGNEHAGVPYNEGTYVRCSPSGTIYHNTLYPGTNYASVK